MTSNLVNPTELSQRLTNKFLMLSSRQLGWNGILVEQYQSLPTPSEVEVLTLSDHWLSLHMGHFVNVFQNHDDRVSKSIVKKGDSFFVPAGQPSYRCRRGDSSCSLHILLKPELIEQVTEASEIDLEQLDLVNCFAKPDLQLYQIAMLLLAELQSGGMMGRLYVESLTQVLVIHLLRHYSTLAQEITSENKSLTHTQLQQAINYIHTHLDQDLSLAELAKVINISPTYFASLFKREIGVSPHQYVIQQRVEWAKVMLSKTDLAIADIAFQVGFSSQSHLTQQFKRLTGMTPNQLR